MAKPKLVHEIKLGAVRCLIWERESDEGPRHQVSLVRADSDAGSPSAFQHDDLPLVAEVADMAHLWIVEQTHLFV